VARLAPNCSSSEGERVVLGIPEVAKETESARWTQRRPAESRERAAIAERSIMGNVGSKAGQYSYE